MKKILLVDYPYPDGQARENALRAMGFDVRVFNLVKSRIWSGQNPVKKRMKPIVNLMRPLKKALAAIDRNRLNQELRDSAAEFRPDVVLVIKGDVLSVGTIRSLRGKQAPLLLNWDPDSMLTPGRTEIVIPRLSLYDHYFTVDDISLLPDEIRGRMITCNANCHSMPYAANLDVFKPSDISTTSSAATASSIVFVGTVNPVRREALQRLSDLNLKIWAPLSSAWGEWIVPGSPLARAYQNGTLYGEDLVRQYEQSGVVVDIHFLFTKNSSIPNVTLRVFEVPAAGGFVLTNDSPALRQLFEPEKEIIAYSTIDDLRQKAEYYLNHPHERRIIAEKGCARVLAQHTFRHRLESIFRITNVN